MNPFYLGKNPEEIKQFINDNFENQLKHCDIKRIRFKLETDGVIDTDQRQQLDQCGTQSEANSVFREILLNDPTTQTLLAAADVLETAPDTTNMNKDFAKAIRQFIQPEGTCNPKFRTLSERCPIEKTNEPTKIGNYVHALYTYNTYVMCLFNGDFKQYSRMTT